LEINALKLATVLTTLVILLPGHVHLVVVKVDLHVQALTRVQVRDVLYLFKHTPNQAQ
jgi:hypothetical protein